MKISDLLENEQIKLADKVGKHLTKMVSNINLRPKTKSTKGGFGDFFMSFQPQQLIEIANTYELKQLQDQISSVLRIPVHSSSHFIDRVFGREFDVSIEDIVNLFQKIKQKYPSVLIHTLVKSKNLQRSKEIEIVAKDYSQHLNITFSPKGNSFELMSIMRKDCDKFITLTKPNVETMIMKVGVKGLSRNH